MNYLISQMDNKTIARNIKVESILKVLSTFKYSDYIDLTIVIGGNNGSDLVRISPSAYKEAPIDKFSLNQMNDFVI